MRGRNGADPRERSSPLTRSELQTRRLLSRRRRTRRRAASGTLMVAVAVIAAVALMGGSGSARRVARHGSHHPASERRHVAGSANGSSYASNLRTSERILGYTPYVSVGTAKMREVALTFDDGPGPYTPKILRILGRTHTPATFFVIGEEAQRYPRFVRAETREGSEIGDHTEIHPYMADLPAAGQRAQIVEAADAIHHAGAPLPTLWRPPYGSFNAQTLAILRQLRMVMVLWTVDTSDYALPGVKHIWYTALSGARPGAIILMHDGGGNRSETVAALPRIIAGLKRRDFRLVTVSQLLATDPPPHGQPPPQPLSGGS